MPYTGGTFTRTSNSFSNPVLGQAIDPTHGDLLFDDYDTGLTNAITKSGDTTTTARIPFALGIRTPVVTTLTIASGAVTATGGYHLIDTEAAGATDDLDTINGGADGAILIIRAADSARTVVAKDATGNLQLAGDHTLDNAQDTLTLLYVSALSAWLELARASNGA